MWGAPDAANSASAGATRIRNRACRSPDPIDLTFDAGKADDWAAIGIGSP